MPRATALPAAPPCFKPLLHAACLFRFNDSHITPEGDGRDVDDYLKSVYGAQQVPIARSPAMRHDELGLIHVNKSCVPASLREPSKELAGGKRAVRLFSVSGATETSVVVLRTFAAHSEPASNGSWVEVTREPFPNEGAGGYGCWFFPLLRPFSRGR